jgi:hypothetical protein
MSQSLQGALQNLCRSHSHNNSHKKCLLLLLLLLLLCLLPAALVTSAASSDTVATSSPSAAGSPHRKLLQDAGDDAGPFTTLDLPASSSPVLTETAPADGESHWASGCTADIEWLWIWQTCAQPPWPLPLPGCLLHHEKFQSTQHPVLLSFAH